MKRYHRRYWNSGDFAVAIVAVISEHNGKAMDWAAYIGATESAGISEETTAAHVADWGAKLLRSEAEAFFPAYRDIPYRF